MRLGVSFFRMGLDVFCFKTSVSIIQPLSQMGFGVSNGSCVFLVSNPLLLMGQVAVSNGTLSILKSLASDRVDRQHPAVHAPPLRPDPLHSHVGQRQGGPLLLCGVCDCWTHSKHLHYVCLCLYLCTVIEEKERRVFIHCKPIWQR